MRFLESLKEPRQEEQAYLESLEAGATVGRKPWGGAPYSWQDQTQSEIEKSRRIIVELDSLIAKQEQHLS